MASRIMKSAAERDAEDRKAKYGRDAKRMVPKAMAKPASGPRHSVRDRAANAFTAAVRGAGSEKPARAPARAPAGAASRSSAPKTSPKPVSRPAARPTTCPTNTPKRETPNARAAERTRKNRFAGKAGNDR